ncbi:CLUMA_CG005133, isoform A [Clunio marinus]|uniref:CLUMA_CG005133, isoform A n=1 Tax=Clunio marinus TaxID=568069 RepID=A0A1J1HV91_9DIPT|nr:CLUMA_CG005133, isoform A [Clunio marinus]
MSFVEGFPEATSTPKQEHFNSEMIKAKNLKENHRLKVLKDNRNIQKPKGNLPPKAVKNFKSKHTEASPRRWVNEKEQKKDAFRREQALEAMKILEQRRLRMNQDSLAEEIEKITLLPKNEARDALMEKKRLEAKRLKEKRILAHLAEQEANKKRKAKATARKEGKNVSSFLSKSRIMFKPKLSLPKLPEETIESDQHEKVDSIDPPTTVVVEKEKQQRTNSIRYRYSLDDLRALNPYGFYFL